MTQHKIMLLGAAGQIGQSLQSLSLQKGFPHNWELLSYSLAECNITNPSELRDTIQQSRPELIINASGVTSVPQAQRDPAFATAVNFHAVAQMAAQCSTLDIPLIHLSTDQVFDGTKTSPYLPDDQMNPINHYGDTKMMGEESVRHELAWHVILRTSSLFSAFRSNILTKALTSIKNKPEVRVVTDLVNAPTYALDVAKAIVVIGSQLLAGKADGYGTFHLTGSPAVSRYDFVEAVAQTYHARTGANLPVLVPTISAEFAEEIRRPAYSALDCQKIKDIYGIEQQDWHPRINEALSLLHNADRIPRH